MPDIPNTTPLGYVGILALAFGIFLILAGLGIINFRQIDVKPGPKTWGFGIFITLLGIVFLLPNIIVELSQFSTPTPAVEVAVDTSTNTPIPPTDIVEEVPSSTPEPSTSTPEPPTDTPIPNPTDTPQPTNTSQPPTSTPTPKPTNTPRPTSTPTLSPTPIPTSTPLVYGELLFEDSFDDNRYGWNVYTGVWIDGGNLHIFPSQDAATYITGTQLNFEDFIYETMVTIVEGSNESANNFGPTLVFRASLDLKQFYQCGIHQRNSGYQCQKADTSVTPEKWDLLIWKDEGPIDTTRETHKITVVARGNNIQLWVDDKLIHSVSDSTYKNGTIGIGSGAGKHVAFDYVRVWSLPQ